jgi:uncharacterized protein
MKALKPSYYNHIFVNKDGSGVLFNSKNTGIIYFDKNEIDRVKFIIDKPQTTFHDLNDQTIFDTLVKNGFLIEETRNEKEELRKFYSESLNSTQTLHFTIAPTLNCNFNCVYCFENRDSHCGKMMSIDTQKRLLDFFKEQLESKHPKICDIMWYGGEPLLGLPVIKNLSEQFLVSCKEAHIDYAAGMITNGYCLTPAVCDQLITLNVSFLQITLDGPESINDCRRILKDGSGSYAQVVENMRHACKKIPISVRINIDKSNHNSIQFLLDDFEHRGINLKDIHIYLGHVNENDNSEANHNHISRNTFAHLESNFLTQMNTKTNNAAYLSFAPFSCGLGKNSAYLVGPKGEMYQCYDDFGNESMIIGSIFSNKRFKSDYVKEFTAFDPMEHSMCRDCTVLPLCMGGCHKQRLLNHIEDHCCVYKYALEKRVNDYVKNTLTNTL